MGMTMRERGSCPVHERITGVYVRMSPSLRVALLLLISLLPPATALLECDVDTDDDDDDVVVAAPVLIPMVCTRCAEVEVADAMMSCTLCASDRGGGGGE